MGYLFPVVLSSRVAVKIFFFFKYHQYNSESILPLVLKAKVRGPLRSHHLLHSRAPVSRGRGEPQNFSDKVSGKHS